MATDKLLDKRIGWANPPLPSFDNQTAATLLARAFGGGKVESREVLPSRSPKVFEHTFSAAPEAERLAEAEDRLARAGVHTPAKDIILRINVDTTRVTAAFRKFGDAAAAAARAAMRIMLARVCTCPPGHPARRSVDWNQHPRRCDWRKKREPEARRLRRKLRKMIIRGGFRG